MPIYEYRCPSNDMVTEVRHGMAERVMTWGELVSLARIDPGDTPSDAPVERILSASVVGGSSRSAPAEACGPSCHCVPHDA